ncbi:MAG TPA: cytochrome c [Chthoniobacterales bacterium]
MSEHKIPEYLIPQKYPKHEMEGRMDYNEAADVGSLHGAIAREKGEPAYEGQNKRLPNWLTVFFCVLLFWSGGYLFLFGGGFRNDVFSERDTAAAMYFPKSPTGGGAAPEVEKTPFELGKSLFTGTCQACHQSTGQGVPGQYPPLAGSEFVVGGERRLVSIVLKGLQGPLTIHGQSFNGQMPGWEASLNDKKIAAILTYVRNEWGNKASDVSPEGVAALRAELASRAESWNESEVRAIPETAPLPGGKESGPAPAAAPH